jgi:predicted nucleic acid-binding protein
VSDFWVINASPVILLAKVGLIEHVSKLAKHLVIPEPVATEITTPSKEDVAVNWLKGRGKQFVRPPAIELPVLSASGIGSGERSVISWAAANPEFTAVLDDYEARLAAQRLGLKVLGTIGVVLRLKQAGLIPDAKTAMLRIRNVGGYFSDALLGEALQRVGEHL